MKLNALFAGRPPELMAFDLDGTLADSAPDLAWAIDQMLLKQGLQQAGLENVREWVGNGSAMLVQRALGHARQCPPDLISKDKLKADLESFKAYYAQRTCRLTQLYPGVREGLACLAELGKPMVVITNKPREFAEQVISSLEIAHYFCLLLGGECLPSRKPDPAPLLYAANKFSCAPIMSLMVGDSKNDILAAKAAGFKSAALSYGYNHGESIALSGPDLLMDSLLELC